MIRELTPDGLDYVFLTGSGFEAANTPRKMARAYWRAKGQSSKTRLIGREEAYRGVNFGGVSVSGRIGNRAKFEEGVEADHQPYTGRLRRRDRSRTGVDEPARLDLPAARHRSDAFNHGSTPEFATLSAVVMRHNEISRILSTTPSHWRHRSETLVPRSLCRHAAQAVRS